MRCQPMAHSLARTIIGFALLMASCAVYAQGNQTIYDEALRNNWVNYSWCATDFASHDYVHNGSSSIKITYTDKWQGFYLHNSGIDGSQFRNLTFWIHGGTTTGRTINVQGIINSTQQAPVSLNRYIDGGQVVAGTWKFVSIPLADLQVKTPNFTGFWLQEAANTAQPAFYVDDIQLTGAGAPTTVNITVDANQIVRTVDDRMFGVNSVLWDYFNNPATINLLNEIDNKVLRFPGGSMSDGYNWRTNNGGGTIWPTTFDDFANVAVQTHAQVYITANYGSSTPQEAAAWVNYSNNTKKYGFKYWEVGNEIYGPWEYDTNVDPHSAYTYANRFADYYHQMKAVDPTIKVGAVILPGEDNWANPNYTPAVNPRTNVAHQGWTPVMLKRMKELGVTPDFVIEHTYPQDPGNETDSGLLAFPWIWGRDATNIRSQLNDYLGVTEAAKVELTITETNSVTYNPGKQTTSLVNGLYLAENLGTLLQSEFNTLIWWDIRNAQEGNHNNDPSLYGWRQYGDYGILSSANDRYPTFYSMKLLSHFARGGDKVIQTTSDYSLLSAYSVKRKDGSLTLLVINKSPSTALTGSFTLANFTPKANGVVYSYGIPQDEAARTGVGSPDVAQGTIGNAGTTFTATFAPYSETVISLAPNTVFPPQSLTPIADTFVRSGAYASANYGTMTSLFLKHDANRGNWDWNRIDYLKFDLTNVTQAPNTAQFNLTLTYPMNSSLPTTTIKAYAIPDTTWTETGMTYNNAPGLIRSTATSTGVVVGTTTVSGGATTLSFDVTSFVRANLGKQVTLQLMVDPLASSYFYIQSREAVSGKPTLDLR